MIFADVFRLKFSTLILNFNPLYYSRYKHVEKNHDGEKQSDEVMNRTCFIHFSMYNIG